MKPLFACGAIIFAFGALSAAEPPKVPEPKKEAAKQDAPKAKDAEEVDVHKTADRIAENAQKAGDRLKEKDPGADTRKIQAEILKDIDVLLKKAQEPPPPPMSSDMPPPKSDMPPPKDGMPPPKGGPGGGMKDMPPPKGGNSGAQGQRPRRERKPRGESPMGKGMNEPMPGMEPMGKDPMPASKDPKGGNEKKDGKEGQGDQFGKTSPKRENDKMAELYKDVWGHLPDRLRQEMDLYYREQFMPRYSELLRQYYSSLAEQRKKSGEGK